MKKKPASARLTHSSLDLSFHLSPSRSLGLSHGRASDRVPE